MPTLITGTILSLGVKLIMKLACSAKNDVTRNLNLIEAVNMHISDM